MKPASKKAAFASQAFTLVEILSTVVIIAILALIGIGSLRKASKSADQAKCLHNMRAIALGVLSYANDNDQRIPKGENPTADVALRDYLGAPSGSNPNAIWKCPADPTPAKGPPPGYPMARSYTFNGMRASNPGQGVMSAEEGLKLTQITKPSSTILLAELFTAAGRENYQYGRAWLFITGWQDAGSIPKLSNGAYYHGKTMNFAFCDGHAEPLDPRVPYQTVPWLWMANR